MDESNVEHQGGGSKAGMILFGFIALVVIAVVVVVSVIARNYSIADEIPYS